MDEYIRVNVDDLPAWIKQERRSQGITVKEMAERLYSNINSIYDVESSHRRKNHMTPFSLTVLEELGYEAQLIISRKEQANE